MEGDVSARFSRVWVLIDIFWRRFAKPTEDFFHTAKAELVKMWGGCEDGSSLSVANFFDRVKTKMLQQWQTEIVQKSSEFTSASSE